MPEGSQNLKDLESRRTDLQKNLKDSRDKLSSTQNQLTVAQKQLDSDKQANQDEIKNFVENLMAQIEGLKAEINKYQAQLDSTNKELKDLKQGIADLNEQSQTGKKPEFRTQHKVEKEDEEPAPVQQEPAPVQQEPAPVQQEPAPAQQEPAPVQQEPAPAQQEPAPAQQEPAPAQQEPAPAQQEPAPAQQEPAPAQQEPAPAQQEPAPAQPELTEQQKYDKLVNLLQEVNNSLRINAGGSYIISANQLAMLEQINQLRSSSHTGIGRLPSRSDLVDNKYLLEDEISRLKEEIKREKKAKKKLKKLHELEKQLAGLKNHNNYNYSVANTLEGINQALESGQYVDTPIAFLNERPFIGKLCDNLAQLRLNGAVQLLMPGQQEPTIVMTEQFASSGQNAVNYLSTCSNKKTPWIVDRISDNTKMSKKQASSAVGVLGAAASIAAIVGVGSWLFTKKDKEGKRSFDFSLGRIGTLVAGLFGLTVGSQALTGKGPMDLLNTFLTTGKTPRSEETYNNLNEEEKLGANQAGLQFALLGVPYPELAQYSSPKTGIVNSIDLQAVRSFHQNRLQIAKLANDTQQITTINGQIATIDELLKSQTGREMINAGLLNLNLNAADLNNPNNANLTLDSRFERAAKNRQEREKFKTTNQVRVAPGKEAEFEKRIYNKENLTESDFRAMQTEGLLIVETQESKALDTLNLTVEEKQEILTAYDEFRGKAENAGLKLEITPEGKIKLFSHGKELLFDPKTKTIPGFKDASGREIPFGSLKEAMQTALFINALKANEQIRNAVPDLIRESDANRPFDLAGGISQLWKGPESLIFKKHDGEPVVISNLLPFVSTMDLKFSTIEAGDNRKFFVNYLNTLWKQDHKNQ